jgi:hypothetical protein
MAGLPDLAGCGHQPNVRHIGLADADVVVIGAGALGLSGVEGCQLERDVMLRRLRQGFRLTVRGRTVGDGLGPVPFLTRFRRSGPVRSAATSIRARRVANL